MAKDQPHPQVDIGLITIKDLLKAEENPNACKDNFGRLRVGAAIGVSKNDRRERLPALLEQGCDVIIVDTAHGHTEPVIQTVKQIKKNFSYLSN